MIIVYICKLYRIMINTWTLTLHKVNKLVLSFTRAYLGNSLTVTSS